MQLLHEFLYAAKVFGVDRKVVSAFGVVNVVPLDVDGDAGSLSSPQHLPGPIEAAVTEAALVVPKTPIRR